MPRLLSPRALVAPLALAFVLVTGAHVTNLQLATKAHAENVHILEASSPTEFPTMGPVDAPVTLEFFLHLGENRSRNAYLLVNELIKRHPKRLRVIFRLMEKSKRAASPAQNFGQEAFVQGRFFEFLDVYFTGYGNSVPSSSRYPEVAARAGVNYKRVVRSFESMEHENVILNNHYYWKRSRIGRVPGYRFNGRPAAGIRRLDDLEAHYDAALAGAKKLRASGVADHLISATTSANDDARLYAGKRFRGPIDQGGSAELPSGPSVVSMAKLVASPLSRGARDPKITLVFVCHFQSRDCGNMSRDLDTIRKAYPDDVRIVFRSLYDESAVTQSKAPLMHQAAMCAHEQAAFWPYYDFAYRSQARLNFNFDQTVAVDLASDSGLDLDIPAFEKCLESGRHLESLAREIAATRAAGVEHTPALVLDGVAYWGRLQFTDLRLLVESALRPGILEQLGAL